MKFINKVSVIEAEQYYPEKMPMKGVIPNEFIGDYVITAHEQRVFLEPGDWVVPEPDAENRYYPVKPDVFNQKYKPLDYDDSLNHGKIPKVIGGRYAYPNVCGGMKPENMTVEVKGSDIVQDGIIVRVDDKNNPGFWLEIFVPTDRITCVLD